MNSKFCSRPFHSITTRIAGTSLEYKPCCHVPGSYGSDLESYLASEELKNIRKHFLESEGLPAECEYCQTLEDNSQSSPREAFVHNGDWAADDGIRRFEIMPNNTCNLSCFMCSPDNSSSLAQEYKQLGWLSKWQSLDATEEMIAACDRLDHLEQASIIGGEFFLAKRNKDLLEKLLEKRIRRLDIYTNATIIDDSCLSLLDGFPELTLVVSLDGAGSCYEFMRYPAVWETVYSNVRSMKAKLGMKKVALTSVMQPLNMQYAKEMLQVSNQLKLSHRMKTILDPSWLSWSILTDVEKAAVRDSLVDLSGLASTQQTMIRSLLDVMDSTPHETKDRREFVKRMTKILPHRQITKERTLQHLGVLEVLAKEITDGY